VASQGLFNLKGELMITGTDGPKQNIRPAKTVKPATKKTKKSKSK